MSQETISKCLITLSNLKGRLDPGSRQVPQPHIFRQAMSRKYTAVEEKGVKIGLSLISRAFVRERQGDVAAVTIVHVGQDEFRVIFGNNRRQGDKLLSSDAAFATRFLMKMMQWYSEQHPVLNDKAALAALREKQVDAILSHIAQTDSRKLVVRKMLALGRLGHWKSKGAEQELERDRQRVYPQRHPRVSISPTQAQRRIRAQAQGLQARVLRFREEAVDIPEAHVARRDDPQS